MNILCKYLLDIDAIKISPSQPFTWASGKLSPIYCDNRITLSYPEVRSEICFQFCQMINERYPEAEVIAGVATGGIPHGMLVANALNLPFVYIRDKPKAHGRQNSVEGHLETNQKVVVIEDLISTGGSSLKAVDNIRQANAQVLGLLAIFTYGFDTAKSAFDNANCSFDTLTNFSELLQYLETQQHNPEEIELMKKWIAEG